MKCKQCEINIEYGKICSTCWQTQIQDNKTHSIQYAQEHYRKYPHKFKYKHKYKYQLRKYGLSDTDYLSLVEKQNNKCAICGLDGTLNRHGRLAVDHDHKTKRI